MTSANRWLINLTNSARVDLGMSFSVSYISGTVVVVVVDVFMTWFHFWLQRRTGPCSRAQSLLALSCRDSLIQVRLAASGRDRCRDDRRLPPKACRREFQFPCAGPEAPAIY